jgi:hypothetical protein
MSGVVESASGSFAFALGLVPGDQPVVGAQAFALAEIVGAGLIEAQQAGHVALPQSGDGDIVAKEPVGQEEIARLEVPPQPTEEA